MPTFLNGSPTHVLVVHAVVVLLPLAVLAALVLVFVPSSRRPFGVATVGLAFVGCLAVPLAFASGDGLRERVGASTLVDRHVAAAHLLAPAAAVFGLALAGFVAVDLVGRARRDELNHFEVAVLGRLVGGGGAAGRRRTGRGDLGRLRTAAALVLVVTAAATVVAVVRAGDTGANAAWHGRVPTGVSDGAAGGARGAAAPGRAGGS